MYSRSYYGEDNAVRIPEHYDGTSLLEKEMQQISVDSANGTLPKVSEGGRGDLKMSPRKTNETVTDVFSDIEGNECRKTNSPLSLLLSGIKLDIRGFEGIGFEELLIAGLALFLLLSKSGDKECALMLLLLIFL